MQAIQELLHQRARRTGDRAGAAEVAEAMARLFTLHELTPDDLRVGLRLFPWMSRLSGRDASLSATAINRAGTSGTPTTAARPPHDHLA